ncbi:MAG: sigma-70 family RNA polymerase sigma factor [Gemmatimonadales bacterium]
MNDPDWLARRFEENRIHLQSVAYRMLGSSSEADDAVQEAWLRLRRADTSDVRNLRGWLTTVVARVSLDMLRSGKARREERLDTAVPDSTVGGDEAGDPEREAVLAESVGLALLVVLDTLAPAERLAFVLHDMFDVPFDEIAPIVGRSPTAARQLASRARRRVRGAPTIPEVELGRQRKVVDAFLAALRGGDFEGLIAVLDPDLVVRADFAAAAGASREVHGAQVWARQALAFSQHARFARTALVNGDVGVVMAPRGRLFRVLRLTITRGRIARIDVVTDPAGLSQLDLAVFDG